MEKLDITDPSTVEDWYERFELFCLTNTAITNANRTAFYLTYAGKEAYSLLKDLAFPTLPRNMTPAELHALIVAHVKPRNLELVSRAKFHSLIRASSESPKEFIVRL